MTANVWSPNLKDVISQLAELHPYKRRTLLEDQRFLNSSNLSKEERKLIDNVYSNSEMSTLGGPFWN